MAQARPSVRRRDPQRRRHPRRPSTRSPPSRCPTGTSRGRRATHTDPWNLVEAAMALDVGGPPRGGRAGVRVAARRCSTIAGCWHAYYVGRRREGSRARHQRHLLPRQRGVAPLPHDRRHRVPRGLLAERRAGDRLRAVAPGARPARSRGGATSLRRGALLTGSSSIHASIRCAIAIAERLGHERPDWELSLGEPRDRHRAPSRRASSTRIVGRWTGTTPSSAACCAAMPRRCGWPRTGKRSSSKGAACAASRTALGSPPPRRASSCMALDALGLDDRAASSSRGSSSCATTTAATGRA